MMVLLLANFLLNLLCSVSNCNPKYGYPEDLTLAVGRNDLGSFDAYPVVRAETGRLRGYTMKAISGRPISAFEGIPYAESPAGVNRFQPPIPKRKWGGIRNAYGVGNVCLQLYTLRGPAVIRGHEDCLFLNIYTLPEAILGEKKLPVIFFIHGGSYFFGTGSEFGPAYLLEKDVILVTFNYRLGVLGFLSTGDDLVPGNNGLKDQALALKWIYDNIENFGGDPSKITVMGQSAGGASAHFHMLHEETRKYIYAGISMSGTTMQPWAWRTEKARRFLNRGLAKQLNCPLKNDELLRCLKSISPYLVVGAQLRMFPVRTTPIILFAPVIENEGKNSSNVPYITKAPTEVYLSNPPNIPWMVTRTNGEAHLLSLVTKTYGRLGRLGFNYIWKNLGAEFLVIENTAADPQEAIEKLQDHYFKGKGPSQVEESAYDDLITDRFHGLGTHKAIVSHYSTAPTYALLMSGPIRFGLATEVLGSKGASESVIHADDVYVVFNGSTISPPFKSTDPEYRLTEIITGLIVNFVNNGTPSYDPPKLLRSEDLVEWPAVEDPCHVEYLNVTTNSTSIATLPKNTLENYILWETLNLDDVPKTPKFCQQPV